MPVNSSTPNFNNNEDINRQALTLQQLLGAQDVAQRNNQAHLQGIQQQGQQAQQLQSQKDTQEQSREARSYSRLREALGLKEGESLPEGTGVSFSAGGGASASRGFNPNTLAHQQQGQQIKETAELRKVSAPISQTEDLLAANRRFQESLDEGTSVGDKNAAISAARLGEGMKARIQQAIIQEFIKGGDSAQGAFAKTQNWFDGAGETTLPAGARNALRSLGQMHYGEAKRAYDTEMQKAAQQAPVSAPFLTSSGLLPTITSSWGRRGAADAQALEKRFSEAKQQGAPDRTQPVQQFQQPPQNLLEKIGAVWKGRQPPQQTQQSKPTTVIQGGHTYTLNPSTGKYE